MNFKRLLYVAAAGYLITIVGALSLTDADWRFLLLITAVVGLITAASLLTRKTWMSDLKQIELVIAAWPASYQPANLRSPEFASISRSLQRMANQIRNIIQDASEESTRRHTILAAMAEGVLAVDQQMNVVLCNDAFAKTFKLRGPVEEGRPLFELVREPALREMLQKVVTETTTVKSQIQLPTADMHWFEAHALPLGARDKNGALVVLHDISDILRQEQARKDFVANVSHELRTPLAAIRGYAETLLDGGLEDGENNRQFVNVILSHAIRLNNIASDLLVLSELDANAPTLPPDSVPVMEVIDSALRTVENVAAMRGVLLRLGHCEETAVIGYRFRLEQALTNLLDNAVKFNRPNGTVQIECAREPDGRVCISVTDTGIGIPSEDLARIFERFYRVDRARARTAGGTGLGLPIVKEVVGRMGGTVKVTSELGKGTCFQLHLLTGRMN